MYYIVYLQTCKAPKIEQVPTVHIFASNKLVIQLCNVIIIIFKNEVTHKCVLSSQQILDIYDKEKVSTQGQIIDSREWPLRRWLGSTNSKIIFTTMFKNTK